MFDIFPPDGRNQFLGFISPEEFYIHAEKRSATLMEADASNMWAINLKAADCTRDGAVGQRDLWANLRSNKKSTQISFRENGVWLPGLNI